MCSDRQADWEPNSEHVQRDQEAAYDAMRERCPIAYSDALGWSVFRHQDIVHVLQDHETFSNAVSRHRSVPNGLDPPEHTKYRRIIERYFIPTLMHAFEPVCRNIAANLAQQIMGRGNLDLISDFALPFAARAQCSFLGWPASSHDLIIRWYRSNQEAIRTADRQALTRLAGEFQQLIESVLGSRRKAASRPHQDVTASLMHEEIDGQRLSNQDIASILRNWTAGEIGTLSAAIGTLVHYLATHPDLAGLLRSDTGLLPSTIDEILRIHGPLVLNRRVAVRKATIGGRTIEAGERLSLIWISGNRDGRVFPNPYELGPKRDLGYSLLYGAGIHECPGAPLARMELRNAIEELLGHINDIQIHPDRMPRKASYPAAGFASLPIRLS